MIRLRVRRVLCLTAMMAGFTAAVPRHAHADHDAVPHVDADHGGHGVTADELPARLPASAHLVADVPAPVAMAMTERVTVVVGVAEAMASPGERDPPAPTLPRAPPLA